MVSVDERKEGRREVVKATMQVKLAFSFGWLFGHEIYIYRFLGTSSSLHGRKDKVCSEKRRARAPKRLSDY